MAPMSSTPITPVIGATAPTAASAAIAAHTPPSTPRRDRWSYSQPSGTWDTTAPM